MKTFHYIIISLLISCFIGGIGMCLSEYIKKSGYTQSEYKYSYTINDSIKFINNEAHVAEYEFNKKQYKDEQNKLGDDIQQKAQIGVAKARANAGQTEADSIKAAQIKAAKDFYKSNITDYNSPYNRARRTYNLHTLRTMGTYGGYGYKYGHGY